jgi:hypothetical protein
MVGGIKEVELVIIETGGYISIPDKKKRRKYIVQC